MEDKKYFEKQLTTKVAYKGLVVDVLNDDIELSNGRHSKREVIKHSGGVVVLAQKGNCILLVKQYRYPVQQAMFELPAGKLETGEDILEAAKRELIEETGYVGKHWESLGYIFTSAGISDEKLYLFKADDLTFIKQQPDENEIIDYFEVPLKKIIEMIKSGEINDSKTICAVMRGYFNGF